VVVDDWGAIRAGCALLEDEAVLALAKPAGISVVGERHDTDLVTLARDAGERLLPVHRIDKVTSGVVLLARRPWAHAELTRQFQRRSARKLYLAVTRSRGLPERGAIDLPLRVGRKNRVRVAGPREAIVFDEAAGLWSLRNSEEPAGGGSYPSRTLFARLWEGRDRTLLLVRPVSGRRHQIRVHLAWIGHPIAGDPLFPDRSGEPAPRTALHAWRIGFQAPWSGDAYVEVEAPPGEDFWACMGAGAEGFDPAVLDSAAGALSGRAAAD
jgi:tRNA pseudouridine32 synthase/23S rRNA pseudouridine746 synthase/23S rRNA pseudouridine1911/1915/1917 synthase